MEFQNSDHDLKLLIVDDQADQLSFLSSILEEEFQHAEILVALDGKGGLAIAKDTQPDLILSDWKMPLMDGMSMVSRLKNLPQTNTIPVILLTGMTTTSSDLKMALEAGAIDFVKKPYDPIEIIARVKAILRFSFQNKELLQQQEATAKAKLELSQQTARMEREQILAHEKIRKEFFSKMTHEFRTPLTLILGPLENILASSKSTAIHQQASMAFRNGKIMLRLINQLLDLDRLDVGQIKLQLRRFDLIAFLDNKKNSFQSTCLNKGITLSLESSAQQLYIDADPELMDQVLNNVIGNAIKFTPKNGNIHISVQKHTEAKDQAQIIVKDSGIGIKESNLPFIFDLYYRVETDYEKHHEGVGLGLPLTKELIKLHQGDIVINSVEGLGTSVSISVPIKQQNTSPLPELDNFNSDQLPIESSIDFSASTTDYTSEKGKSLMIVDDNADIRKYIIEAMRKDFDIIEAFDGRDGLEKAQEFVPDIIISDILMPKMNGFELCERIKHDQVTSHIPVILLTGSTNEKEKIRGFKTGAEAFIPKPFSAQALALQTKNLLDNQQRRFAKYKKEIMIHPDKVNVDSREEKFLIKLKEIISEDLSNDQLSVELLAEKMALSRTQLYRKLKTITDQNVSEFIRNYRLEHAKQLLEKNSGTIAEIAFQSGFSSTSYFSKSFSLKYGVSPKKVQKEGFLE